MLHTVSELGAFMHEPLSETVVKAMCFIRFACQSTREKKGI